MGMDKQTKMPLYRQIYTALRGEIDNGAYRNGDRIPSEKELTGRFQVERNTVRKALQMLVDDGLVVKVPGYGTKVASPGEARPGPPARLPAIQSNILLATTENYLQDSDGEYFHVRLIQSFERIFSKAGYNLLFKSVEKGTDFLEVIHQTHPMAIILDSYNQETVYQEAVQSGIPCVSVNHYTPLITSVVSNNFDGAYQAAKLLTDAGHRKIAYITGKRNYQTSIERLSGVQRLYMQIGMPLDPKYIFTGNWQFPSGAEAAEQILAMPASDRPTAVFAFNDDMSFGCLSCFEKHGLSVPGDISLVGFDKSDRFQSIFRPITTVDVNIDAIVEYTYWYLSGRLAGSAPKTNARIDIDAAIVDNGTVRVIRPEQEIK